MYRKSKKISPRGSCPRTPVEAMFNRTPLGWNPGSATGWGGLHIWFKLDLNPTFQWFPGSNMLRHRSLTQNRLDHNQHPQLAFTLDFWVCGSGRLGWVFEPILGQFGTWNWPVSAMLLGFQHLPFGEVFYLFQEVFYLFLVNYVLWWWHHVIMLVMFDITWNGASKKGGRGQLWYYLKGGPHNCLLTH